MFLTNLVPQGRQFEQLFPGQIIETIDSREVSRVGGVLNSITWHIKVYETARQPTHMSYADRV